VDGGIGEGPDDALHALVTAAHQEAQLALQEGTELVPGELEDPLALPTGAPGGGEDEGVAGAGDPPGEGVGTGWAGRDEPGGEAL
jgi:hypothetical protein